MARKMFNSDEMDKVDKVDEKYSKDKTLFENINKEKESILSFLKSPVNVGLVQTVIDWNPYNDIAEIYQNNEFYKYDILYILNTYGSLIESNNTQFYPDPAIIEKMKKNQKVKDLLSSKEIFQISNTNNLIKINGQFVFISQFPNKENNLLILLSMDDKVIEITKNILNSCNCINKSNDVVQQNIFSKRLIIHPMFTYTNIIAHQLFVDRELRFHVERAYYFFTQNEFDTSISHLGKAFEELITQIYQFLFKKYPDKKLTIGNILQQINVDITKEKSGNFDLIKEQLNNFDTENTELKKLKKILQGMIEILVDEQMSKVFNEVKFNDLLKDLNDQLKDTENEKIKDLTKIFIQLINSIKEEQKYRSKRENNYKKMLNGVSNSQSYELFPQKIRPKLQNLLDKRNLVAHNSGKFFQYFDSLEMLIDFLSIYFWWIDVYKEINSKSEKKDEIFKSILDFNKEYIDKVF